MPKKKKIFSLRAGFREGDRRYDYDRRQDGKGVGGGAGEAVDMIMRRKKTRKCAGPFHVNDDCVIVCVLVL